MHEKSVKSEVSELDLGDFGESEVLEEESPLDMKQTQVTFKNWNPQSQGFVISVGRFSTLECLTFSNSFTVKS